MEYSIEVGTIPLIICCFVFLLIIRSFCVLDNISDEIGIIDRLVLLGLLARIIWMFIVIFLSRYKYYFFVIDDETYFNYAMGKISEAKLYSMNIYCSLLRTLYDLFGKTSVNGRILNMFISISTAYPLATLEKRLKNNTGFPACRMIAYSPFMVFISFFEIKDIFVLFLFICAYAILKRLQERMNIAQLILFISICFLSELFRKGAGAIPVMVLVISKVPFQGATKKQKYLIGTAGAVLAVVALGYVGQAYFSEQTNEVQKYQRWITSQFSKNSIYNSFMIRELKDIWKVPLCYFLYTLQPLSAFTGDHRFFADFGMIAKYSDVPVLLLSLIFLPGFIKKEKWNSLLFIIPYTFTSCINLTNARQGFFLYPIMYLIFFDRLESINEEATNKPGKYIIAEDKSKPMNKVILAFYLIWLLFVLYRIR